MSKWAWESTRVWAIFFSYKERPRKAKIRKIKK